MFKPNTAYLDLPFYAFPFKIVQFVNFPIFKLPKKWPMAIYYDIPF